MAQKIKPLSLRLGIIEPWRSRWWAKRSFGDRLEEDHVIRQTIQHRVNQAGIVRIDIERGIDNTFKVTMKVARPGLVIGRGGKGIEELTADVKRRLASLLRSRGAAAAQRGAARPAISLSLNIEELRRTEVSAQYVAQSIAWDLEKRMRARRTIKRYLDLVMQNRDVQGAKIRVGGRLDGNEIARQDTVSRGKLPLQTLRANIDYGEASARTTYGSIGVKVWIYKGEVFEDDKESGTRD